MNFLLTDQPTDACIAPVPRAMRAHNVEVNPEFMAAMEDDAQQPRPLCVFAQDESGGVVGGVLGDTQFKWCKIRIIAVEQRHRAAGVATELLRRAEAEAAARGCRYVYLDSMDYHAPSFYAARGYECAGTIEDWDSRGHTKFYFTKRIGA